MPILVFDEKELSNFLPLTATRSVGELRSGVFTLAERTSKIHSKSVSKEIHYPWDLISNLKETLEEDLVLLGAAVKGRVHPSSVLVSPDRILIEEGAIVEPLCVLDASAGPIYIGKQTVIKSHTTLRGPLAIGPSCRIGGEVSHSIIQGNTNKAHYGFLGHAYVGEWVNLGAGTTNSNLKNTYGTIKLEINGKEIDSNLQFMGCLIGDHVKAGIGTLINTGTVIGVGANVLGGKITPKVIPDFSWDDKTKWEWKRFIETVKRVYLRRNRELTKEAEDRLFRLYQKSS